MIITSRVSDKLATTSKVLANHKIFAGEEFIQVEKIHLLCTYTARSRCGPNHAKLPSLRYSQPQAKSLCNFVHLMLVNSRSSTIVPRAGAGGIRQIFPHLFRREGGPTLHFRVGENEGKFCSFYNTLISFVI